MCLIKEHNHFQFSFSFMEDIEKVFFGIFSQTVLEKIGMNKKLFESKVVQSKAKETRIHFARKNELVLDLKSLGTISNVSSKVITEKVTSINEQQVTSNFIITHHIYINSSDNTTVVIFEITSNLEDDPFVKMYLENISKDYLFDLYSNISCYLNHWKKNVVTIESIVINRPMKQVFEYISDCKKILKFLTMEQNNTIKMQNGNQYIIENEVKKTNISIKVKKVIIESDKCIIISEKTKNNLKSDISFSIIKLSPITSFVVLENNIKFRVKGDYLSLLSEYNQQNLKEMKEVVEGLTCYEE